MAKRGRPATGRKRLAIQVSLLPEEKERLDQILEVTDMNRSDFMRWAMDTAWALLAVEPEAEPE